MSKKTIRNRWIHWLGAVAGAAVIAILGCATKSDGDGSESHFLCSVDSDCVTHGTGNRCVEQKCTSTAGPEAGATGGSGNTMNGTGGDVACPDPFYYPPGTAVGSGPPSESPPGFVDGGVYGCHAPRNMAPSSWTTSGSLPACPGTSGSCTYAPTALPRGLRFF